MHKSNPHFQRLIFNEQSEMWLTVAMCVTTALFLAIQAESEILRNGLPENCGKRLPLTPPLEPYDGSKREAPPHSWPWHVGLYFAGFGAIPFCGGTLISPTWVLTAAHCITAVFACKYIPLGVPIVFEEVAMEILAVKVGSHNFTNDHPRAHIVLVKQVIMHPKCSLNGRKSGYDIALLKLTREVKRSKNVGFACLPESGFKFDYGKVCYTAGWGHIALSAHQWSKQPEVLMEQPTTITRAAVCEAVMVPPYSKKNICGQQSRSSSCVGDSGGGLHCSKDDGTWTLYGVLSHGGDGCYGGVALSGATDAALTWIKTTIQTFN